MGESGDYKEWVAFAKQDLDSAVYLKKMVPLPIEIICYHCHQCAEKMLKALLFKIHYRVPRTHDLMVLALVFLRIFLFILCNFSSVLAFIHFSPVLFAPYTFSYIFQSS